MRPFDDPALLAPHQRLREIALIFAAALHRLRVRALVSPSPDGGSGPPPETTDSVENPLDVPLEPSVTVHTS